MIELVVDNTVKRSRQPLPESVVVYTTTDIVDALFAKLILGSADIRYKTANEPTFAVFPCVFPVYFFVAEQDAQEAHMLLQAYQVQRDQRRNRACLLPVE